MSDKAAPNNDGTRDVGQDGISQGFQGLAGALQRGAESIGKAAREVARTGVESLLGNTNSNDNFMLTDASNGGKQC